MFAPRLLPLWLADPACRPPSGDFPLLDVPPTTGHALVLDAQGLWLRDFSTGASGPVRVDFCSGAQTWRRQHGGGRGQAIARACGLKGGATPRVLDATAGLGGDAFVLASLGCTVDLIERSPVAAALLADGLRRAREDAEVSPIAARMTLYTGDAAALLNDWLGDPARQRPEVVYLDPMFPGTRQKSAKPNKTMQAFQAVIGADADADALLAPARALALDRIVVKRPRRAPPLAGLAPHHVLEGDSVRFDVYLPSR